MTEYKVIPDLGPKAPRHGVFEVKEAADGGSREVARFYELDDAQSYVDWRGRAVGKKVLGNQGISRADEAREKISSLRMPHPEESPFESRRRGGESLDPPTRVAPIPMVNESCPDCGNTVTETDPRIPDPDAPPGGFRWVHTGCLNKRVSGPA